MIAMVRTLGAPVIEALGNRWRRISVTGAGVWAVTVEVICNTVG